jgi:hypothetical protein
MNAQRRRSGRRRLRFEASAKARTIPIAVLQVGHPSGRIAGIASDDS